MPCNPQELAELARLLSKGKYGESDVVPLAEEYTPAAGAVVERRRKLGLMFNVRTMRGAFPEEFVVNAVNKLQNVEAVAENRRIQQMGQVLEAVSGVQEGWFSRRLGVREDINTRLATLLEKTDAKGNIVGIEATEAERTTAKRLRGLYNEWWEEGKEMGIVDPETYLNHYRPLLTRKPKGILADLETDPRSEMLRDRLGQKGIRFVHALERTGNVVNPDPTLTAGVESYVSGMYRMKMKRVLDEVESEYVNKFFDVKFVATKNGPKPLVNDAQGYNFWLDYKNHLLGGPLKGDQTVTYMLQSLAEPFGKTVSSRAAYTITRFITSMFYGGVLGGPIIGTRPASLIRHAFRLVPSFAELGARDFVTGFSKAVSAVTTNREELVRLTKEGLLTSPYQDLERQVGIARGVGRVVSEVADSFLTLFRASDQLWRASTALGAESRFNRFVDDMAHLPGRKELVEATQKLVQAGRVDDARRLYAFDHLANLEYVYGKANRPKALRGAIGQAIGLLQSYPLNTLELYRLFLKRAGRGVKGAITTGDPEELREALPLIRQVAVAGAAIYAGAEFLNADLSRVFLHGVLPTVPPLLQVGLHGLEAGVSSVESIVGNIATVGEDVFHKRRRHEATNQFARSMRDFIPGSLFGQNLLDVHEDGDVLKFLGFPPVAKIRDEISTKRRLASAKESRLRKAIEKRAYGAE